MSEHLPSFEGDSKPLLVLAPARLDVHPPDPQSLSSLWTVFSKCKDSLENGRRLENLSWRLWNRELLLVPDADSPLQAPESAPGLHDGPAVSPDLPPEPGTPLVAPHVPASRSYRHLSSEELQNLLSLVSGEHADPKILSPHHEPANSHASQISQISQISHTRSNIPLSSPQLDYPVAPVAPAQSATQPAAPLAPVQPAAKSMPQLPLPVPKPLTAPISAPGQLPPPHIPSTPLTRASPIALDSPPPPPPPARSVEPSTAARILGLGVTTSTELPLPEPKQRPHTLFGHDKAKTRVSRSRPRRSSSGRLLNTQRKSDTNIPIYGASAEKLHTRGTSKDLGPKDLGPTDLGPTDLDPTDLGTTDLPLPKDQPKGQSATAASSSSLFKTDSDSSQVSHSSRPRGTLFSTLLKEAQKSTGTPTDSRGLATIKSAPGLTRGRNAPSTESLSDYSQAVATDSDTDSEDSEEERERAAQRIRTSQNRRSLFGQPQGPQGTAMLAQQPVPLPEPFAKPEPLFGRPPHRRENSLGLSGSDEKRPGQLIQNRDNRSSSKVDSFDEEDDDDEDNRLSSRHRSATSTSIVRGFSPSNISISVVNRNAWQQHQELKKSRSSQGNMNEESEVPPPIETPLPEHWKPTKARPDKLAREKMFFIESSPSDSEFGGESLSSSDLAGLKKGMSSAPDTAMTDLSESKSSEPDLCTSKSSERKPSDPKSSDSNLAQPIVPKSPRPSLDGRKRSSLFANNNGSRSSALSVKIGKAPKVLARHDDDDEDDDDDDDDDEENDSAWDSVDDESDSSFDERTFFVRDEEAPKKPLIRPSLLSSLFLDNHALLQEQLSQARGKQRGQQRRQTIASPTGISIPASDAVVNQSEGILNATVAMHIPPPGAMSPRSTRRNMLATELSESLRRHLLWERQQDMSLAKQTSTSSSSSTSPTMTHGALRRSHTSTGVVGMGSITPRRDQRLRSVGPEEPAIGTWKEDMNENNLDFNYHARGW